MPFKWMGYSSAASSCLHCDRNLGLRGLLRSQSSQKGPYCAFRPNPDTHSSPKRSGNPAQSEQPLRPARPWGGQADRRLSKWGRARGFVMGLQPHHQEVLRAQKDIVHAQDQRSPAAEYRGHEQPVDRPQRWHRQDDGLRAPGPGRGGGSRLAAALGVG